mgnify:CR=1 FL=1
MAETTNRSIKIFINGKEIENTAGSIRSAYGKVNNELSKLEIGSEAYNKKIAELKLLGGVLDDHAARLNRVEKASSFMTNFASALGVMTGAQLMTSAIDKLGNEFSAGVEDLKTYSTNLAEMADVMGLTEDQIKDFEDRAKSLTNITLEGGQSIKTSAGDILEAFKLVAGANPELLDVEGGLEAVTRSALVLSRASGEDLATSVSTLTTVMGQFSVGADEAERIINSLAAGSKAGAAETTDVAESMKQFGVVAANSNISIEESVGLIETLATRQLKGAEAGTNLRNVLTKLASVDIMPEKGRKALEAFGVNLDVLKDKSLPLEERLKELAKTGGDATAMAAAFGTENLVAASILAQSVDTYSKFTKEVTGTTAAYDSANTKSKSFAVTMKDMKIAWENIRLTAVKFLVDAALPFAKWVLVAMQALAALPKFIADNRTEFGLLTVALLAWNYQAIAATANSLRLAAVEKGRAIVTNAVTIAQRALNFAMTANPIGAVIAAVAVLAAGFMYLYKNSQTVRNGIAGLGAVAKEVFTIIKESVAAFASGWSKLKDGDISGALSDFGKGLIIANPVALAIKEGKRLGAAYSKGVAEQIASEKVTVKPPSLKVPTGQPPKPPKPPKPPGGDLNLDGTTKADKESKEEKEKRELEEHLAKLREIVKKHEVDLAKSGADDTEKGLIAIREKYRNELDEVTKLEAAGSKEAGEMRLSLERLMAGEISEYKAKALKELDDKTAEASKSELQKIRDSYKEKYALITELENNGLLTRQEAADKTVKVTDQMNKEIMESMQKAAFEQMTINQAAKIQRVQDEVKYEEDRLNLLGTAQEKTLAAVNKQYDDLLQAAKKAGMDQATLDELNAERRKALLLTQLGEIDSALSAMSSAFGSMGDAIGQMIDQGGKKMEGFIGFQKLLTIAQIAFDTARAISGIIAAATKSTTWYEAVIGIVAGVAAVLTNMAKAKALLSTPVPKYQQKKGGGYTDVIGADDNKRYRAEQLGAVRTGMLPSHPVTILASEEGGEYFVSNPDMKNPVIASLVGQIDTISKGGTVGTRQMVDGGYNGVSAGIAKGGDSSMMSLMMACIVDCTKTNKALLDSISNGIPAIVGDKTTVDIFEKFRNLNKTAGGTLG